MKKPNLLAISLIIILILIAYANALKNDFAWDDNDLILENPGITSWRNVSKIFTHNLGYSTDLKNSYYRPLQELTYLIDYSVWRFNPFGYHLGNIAIHIFNTLLLLWLLYSFSNNRPASIFAAVFFAVHPIHTSAVTYIAGRADLLYAFFLLVGILSFNIFLKKESRQGILYYALSVLSFILALLSKETAVTLPFLLLLSGYTFVDREQRRRFSLSIFRAVLPFFVILITYFCLRLTILRFNWQDLAAYPSSLWVRLLTACKAVFIYLKIVLFPVDLHMWRKIADVRSIFEPASLIILILLLLFFTNIRRIYRHSKPVFFGISWFIINIVPVSNIVPLRYYIAENWVYVASMGLFFAAAVELLRLDRARPVFIKKCLFFITGIAVILYTGVTVKRNFDWKDDLTIFKHTIKYAPESPLVHFGLAQGYDKAGAAEEAIAAYRNVSEGSKQSAHAHNNLGVIYRRRNSFSEAIKEYKKSLANDPDYIDARLNLAAVYVITGRLDEAEAECQTAIAKQPDFAPAYAILGDVYRLRKLPEQKN